CSTIFHNLPPPTHLYSLSLHDALPIYSDDPLHGEPRLTGVVGLRITVLPGLHMPVHSWVEEHQYEPTDGEQNEHVRECHDKAFRDRKSTRLNSSHVSISYAVICLKKKK